MSPLRSHSNGQLKADKNRMAARVAGRLRLARLRANMTQQQLAGDRYTKAYISALENALILASLTALDYLAARLGIGICELMSSDREDEAAAEGGPTTRSVDVARGDRPKPRQ